jgi:hypothetical protein
MFCVAAVEIVTAACAGPAAASAAKAANAVRLLIISSQPFSRERHYTQRKQNENMQAHRSG